jgi:hypothetical protein
MKYQELLQILQSHPEWSGREVCYLCPDGYCSFFGDGFSVVEANEWNPYPHVLFRDLGIEKLLEVAACPKCSQPLIDRVSGKVTGCGPEQPCSDNGE